MKKLFFLALAMGAAISCSTENVEGTSGVENGVLVKLVSAESTSTRGVGKHVGAVKAVLNDGAIYFTTAAGGIQSYVTLTGGANANDAYDAANHTVGVTVASTTGFTVQNLPGSVSKVYVIGNFPASTLPTTGNISQFNTETSISVNSQYNAATGGVEKVTLQGSSNLTGTNPNLTATVLVKPIVARMEIGRVTAQGRIKSFKLKGIYINNFHNTMGIEGRVASEEVFIGPDQKNEYSDATNATYPLNGVLAEWNTTSFVGLATSTVGYGPVANPTADDVWAFNILAPQATANNAALPHVIIKISDVVVVDDHGTSDPSDDTDDAVTYGGTKWLTIRNYYKTGVSVPMALLEPGNVYRIGDVYQSNKGDITFDEDDLTDDPELATINVQVTANIMTWIPNEVGYDFN